MRGGGGGGPRGGARGEVFVEALVDQSVEFNEPVPDTALDGHHHSYICV